MKAYSEKVVLLKDNDLKSVLTKNPSILIGKLFEAKRTELGISTAEVAKYVSIPVDILVLYENGEQMIPLVHVYGISNFLGVSPRLIMDVVEGQET